MTPDEEERAKVAGWWRNFAETQCRGYSPLYERICHAVAENDEVIDLVRDAPFFGQQPNVLLAAVHDLVLRGIEHPLAAVYAGTAPVDDVGSLFCDLALRERDEIGALLSFRRTNTNECGRTAVMVPALRWATSIVGEPISLLDAGASAGLNLNLDRYRLDYGSAGATGPLGASVEIACRVSGPAPIETSAPEIVDRIGLDQSPVDLDDDAEVRWLLACTWPDTGRLERTRTAIALAQQTRHPVVKGDLVNDIGAAVDRLDALTPLCVTTTWVVAYLRREARAAFAERLASLSADRPVVWIRAEAAGFVDELPEDADLSLFDGVEPSVLGATVFDGGAADVTAVLGVCHPHGSALQWLAQLPTR